MPPKIKKTSSRPSLKSLITIIKQTKQQPNPIKAINLVSESEKKRRLKVLNDCVEIMSGGFDIGFILELFLKQHRLKPTLHRLTGLFHPRYSSLIQTLKKAHEDTPDHKQKRLILSLLTPTHPFKTIKELGFKINQRNFTSSNKHCAQVGPGQPIPKPQPPLNKRKITEEREKHFHDFLIEHSHEAANRTIKEQPVRYVEGSFNYLFKKYKFESGTDLSLSTLRNHTPVTFKRARKETDLCDYCESEQPIRKQLKQAEVTKQQQTESKQDTKEIQTSILKLKESIQFIESHQNTAQQQRELFKQQQQSLHSNECQIVFDFKENITVGNGPRETNRDFYSKSQRSVFLFTVYYKDKDTLKNKANNKTIAISAIKHQYFHFISEVLAHDGLFVCECLTQLHKLPFFKKFDTVYYWSDCGPHFRNYEVLNHTVFDIPRQFRIKTQHQFWGEKHGKSVCDSEFSVLSQWLSQINTTKTIRTTAELLDSLRTREADNKAYGGMVRTFIEYKREGRPEHITKAEFNNIQSYHYFSKHSLDEVICKVMSNSEQQVIQYVSFKKHVDNRKQKIAPEFNLSTKLPGRNSLSAWRKGKETETNI
jgi:hypothetical protein